MALPFSNTAGRTLERLRNAFIETARGAREVVGAPLRPDLPDDDIPRLKSRIAGGEGRGDGTTRPRGRAGTGLPVAVAGGPKEVPADPRPRLRPAARGGDGEGRRVAFLQAAATGTGRRAGSAGGPADARV